MFCKFMIKLGRHYENGLNTLTCTGESSETESYVKIEILMWWNVPNVDANCRQAQYEIHSRYSPSTAKHFPAESGA